MLQDTISHDLKSAMLAGEKQRVSVLRSLKSAITYAEVAAGTKGGDGLDEIKVVEVLEKEAKKRQESADSFAKAGDTVRAESELTEKRMIEVYLPRELDEEEIRALVETAVAQLDEVSPKAIGQVIGYVKTHAQGRIDGALVARLSKDRLSA